MNKFLESQNYFREFGSIATDWELRNLTGVIYKITNLINGKAYMGQTVKTFYLRYRNGKWWKNTHNEYLKRAAIKYGKENFKIEIFEYYIIDINYLNTLELMYSALFNTLSPNGYNLIIGGGNRRYSEEVKRKIGFANSKDFIFIDMNGTEYYVESLQDFCKQKNLPYQGMIRMIRLSKKTPSSCHGFTLKGTDIKRLRCRRDNIKKFINILTGQIIECKNYREIAEITGLKSSGFSSIFNRRTHSYKGWQVYGKEKITRYNIKNHVYTLFCDTGKREIGTIKQLSDKLNIAKHKIYQLIYESLSEYKGWKYINDNNITS